MAKIKSTTAAVFEPMLQDSGTILIEINSLVNDVISNNFRCNINYYHLESFRLLTSKNWILPEEKASLILAMQLNGSANIDNELANFLLEKIQTELIDGVHTIFNLLPENWEIVE
ncbi:hypothetical protein [Flavobacterium sp. 38-13]|uniref:hypothetical protein n=1 Tax=Flavobacterium sp. 38-13 TaxID=1896168 RepID=UPI000A8CC47F|nr:hypothetical protein [Flavobacterium sp. 38-13]